jgi:hypothetical protein
MNWWIIHKFQNSSLAAWQQGILLGFRQDYARMEAGILQANTQPRLVPFIIGETIKHELRLPIVNIHWHKQ